MRYFRSKYRGTIRLTPNTGVGDGEDHTDLVYVSADGMDYANEEDFVELVPKHEPGPAVPVRRNPLSVAVGDDGDAATARVRWAETDDGLNYLERYHRNALEAVRIVREERQADPDREKVAKVAKVLRATAGLATDDLAREIVEALK